MSDRGVRMTKCAMAVVIAWMNPAVSAAQPGAPADAGAPATHMVRAAGMPLRDGALPPGSLTVRLVQGAFAADLTGIPVSIELDGGQTRTERTGAMGRAEFAHLPIGAQVRASAMINGERLQSEPFPMPSESGVRILLVTGTGAADDRQTPAAPGTAPVSAAAATTSGAPESGATAVRVTVVSLTILAFAFVGAQHLRRRRS